MIEPMMKPCPFCGNPPEIVADEPFEWMRCVPVARIRCSSRYCPANEIRIRFQIDNPSAETVAKLEWNTRRRKNKLMYKEKNDD